MLRCSNCGGNADTLDAVLLNIDGDFACSKKCAREYEAEKNRFFNCIATSEQRTEDWLRGKID